MNSLKGKEAKAKILEGIDLVADMVKVTIGPNGRNVILDQHGMHITNDGISIAKEIRSDDRFVQMGIEFIQNAAKEANSIAGDGTSTTIVLIQALAHEAFNALDSTSVTKLRKELKEATLKALEQMKSRPADLKKIAVSSVEDKELGELIAQTVEDVGEHGSVTYEEGESVTEVELKQGYVIEAGYKNPHMMNTPKTLDHSNLPILVWNHQINSLAPLEEVVKALQEEGKTKLAIVCPDVSDGVVQMILQNHLEGIFTIIPIQIHAFMGDVMEDIAHFTGARYVHNLQSPKKEDLGTLERLIQSNTETTLSAQGSPERIEELTKIPVKGKEKMEMEKRIGKLSGKMAVIKVGADSKSEKDYLIRKVEDAINATKGAKKAGCVDGGGCAYAQISLKGKDKGTRVLSKALLAPVKNILKNSDIDYPEVKHKVKKGAYNVLTGKLDDITDSYLTVETALKIGVSAVATLLTIEGVVVNMPPKK